jgi:hypothetical protein
MSKAGLGHFFLDTREGCNCRLRSRVFLEHTHRPQTTKRILYEWDEGRLVRTVHVDCWPKVSSCGMVEFTMRGSKPWTHAHYTRQNCQFKAFLQIRWAIDPWGNFGNTSGTDLGPCSPARLGRSIHCTAALHHECQFNRRKSSSSLTAHDLGHREGVSVGL